MIFHSDVCDIDRPQEQMSWPTTAAWPTGWKPQV